ncbi:LysR family transcriptional regulator [Brevibacterium sp. FAM 25378]|uniref:LysR family transcriptional regulator n=1 Tax=unclassified Brevibacterium TaxID=2614124 RepID=UPI00109273D9|nr:LysR family transcriptional regulator [Brevibacterium sp. S22]TGD28023.1 LysR family transcriptional regulator [Brevibacterium sp. S22]
MGLDFTLVQLRYFHEVARRENMTEAARQLNVTQSAISTAMSQLERTLGLDLFIRQRNRSVVLSPAGKRFLAEVSDFLEASDALGETAQGLSRSLSGQLTVGVFSPIAPTRLPLIHNEFERRYPDVRVNYLEADLEQLQRAVIAGDCDLALTYTLGVTDRFESFLIDVVEPHVLVSQNHRLANGGRPEPVYLRELAEEDYIQLDLPFSRQYYDELFRIAGVIPKIRHSFSGYETLRSFVAMGHGYSLLSQSVSSGTYIGMQAVDIPLRDDFPNIDLAILWPEGVRLNRRGQAFCELSREVLGR